MGTLPSPAPTDGVILVTGASRGLGRALVEAALAGGWNVVATARDRNTLNWLEGSAQLLRLELDITDPSTLEAAVEQTIGRFERLDVIVNNAGHGVLGALEETPVSVAERLLREHVLGPMELVQLALPHMREQEGGVIVQVGSILGIVPRQGFGPYGAAKAALMSWSGALRDEVARHGIRVLVVAPSGFRSDWSGPSMERMRRMPAYAKLDEMRDAFALDGRVHGTEMGDPVAIAADILRLVQDPGASGLQLYGASAVQRATRFYSSRIRALISGSAAAHRTDRPATRAR